MGLFEKLFSGSASKQSARLKQASKLLDGGKLGDAAEIVNELMAEDSEGKEGDAELRSQIGVLSLELFNAYVASGKAAEALAHADRLAGFAPQQLPAIADRLVDSRWIEPEVFDLVRRAGEQDSNSKRLLLNLAKNLYSQKGEHLDEKEFAFLRDTAIAYPLWKDGLGVLADHYLRDNRRDPEALEIYRNAYQNRKADRKLREVLLESLIVNNEKDEFAAGVYRDVVETSDNLQALQLLASYYIEHEDFHPGTIPYIERALERGKLENEVLQKLTELALNSGLDFLDKLGMCLAIYRQGFSDRNLLTFLSDKLAESNKFDDEAIEIMTRAFEQRTVTKRAVLILAEHCLANDREDEFAMRVYESYLSQWPDRPQRRIYQILAHQYAELTRVDDQAQKIYEEALVDNPTDPVITAILARAYHAADRRDEIADSIYKQAFQFVDEDVRKMLAEVLAEIRLEAKAFNAETLNYLVVLGRPEKGPLAAIYDEALTNCFLNTGRRGEQAQQAYYALFDKTEKSDDINPRLVDLLAEIILESGARPQPGSVEMRVYRKLFELKKFSTPEEIAFALLIDILNDGKEDAMLLNVAVRCFEADSTRLTETVAAAGRAAVLQDVGDFFIEHFNYPLASRAYEDASRLNPSSTISFRLAKIYIMEGRAKEAISLLESLDSKEFGAKRDYWIAAARQMLGQVSEAGALLSSLESADEIPDFLLELRTAINLELDGKLQDAHQRYLKLVKDPRLVKFQRWLGLQIGIVRIRLGELSEAIMHLEEILRLNPSGRAEQVFLSLALFFQGHKHLREDKLGEGLPLFTRAVEVNRNDRTLRQVIVDVLRLYGEKAFFSRDLDRATRVLDVSHRILPNQMLTKTYLAYAYHLKKEYAKAIIYYREISWKDEDPSLERSNAYAYMLNQQPDKAWRVFLDLARRGNLANDNFPRMVDCFLSDPEAQGGKVWQNVEFPDQAPPLMQAAVLIHDGLYERAVSLLDGMLRQDPKDTQVHWYLGRAYSAMNKRDMAVHHWKELLRICNEAQSAPDKKIRQFTEIGMAFMAAGYAQEAMATWETLRKVDESNPDLPVLYAATLDLNAYQLARKDQHKLALEEWKKSLKFDEDNAAIQQNLAIGYLMTDNYEECTRSFHRLGKTWQVMINQNPRKHSHLSQDINTIEKAMNTFALTKGRPEFDLTKVRAEDSIAFFKKANQFYWMLSLDKNAHETQIEREYFRLIKIFNPERHADDFMLVEEAYTNLYANKKKRQAINLFVFNPVDVEATRGRLTKLPRDGKISFETLPMPKSVPDPDYSQLEPWKADEGEITSPLLELLQINLKIPDGTLV
ncbi:MAG: hypothetical protein H7A35_09275 [Planctomycetales bacterium]|nr:MAG: hypothetical protein H7A35_09275 [Planctomycetales bacterium]